MQNDRILGYFLEEAVEHLNTIEQGLRNLPETVKQPDLIRELFRAAHSIKGSAAMLGLTDVQQVGNQFEANFKLLKEQPQIAVDRQLQALFLESFRFLAAGIEEVKTSSDPYRKDPATPDPIGDPVFEELKAYLQHLVATGNQPASTPANLQIPNRDPAIEQVFGEYVTTKLDAINHLCLQPDRAEVRSEIQHICQKLGSLGENFEFLEWTNLFAACRLAMANQANPLAQLGKTISIAVKQAQILVLADRHQEIGITPDLAEAIGNHHSAVGLTTENINTWELANLTDANLEYSTQKLIGRDNHPIILTQQSVTIPAADRYVQPLEFNASDMFVAGEVCALSTPATLSTIEVHSNTELNDFMNLLSDDMPTEGTWMQDDFFDREIPVKDFDESMFFQTELTIQKTEENIQKIEQNHYEEETFYDPDFEGASQLGMADFLSTTQLAAAQDLSPFMGLELDDNDRQLQPDFTPRIDLTSPAPDFGLDRPMSELFPISPTPPSLDEREDRSINNNNIDNSIPELVASPAGINVAPDRMGSNDFHVDFQESSVEKAPDLDRSLLEPLEMSIEVPNFTDEIELLNADLLSFEELTDRAVPASFEMSIAAPDFTNEIESLNSDLLSFEELADRAVPASVEMGIAAPNFTNEIESLNSDLLSFEELADRAVPVSVEMGIAAPNFTNEIESLNADLLSFEELTDRDLSVTDSTTDKLNIEDNSELEDWIERTMDEYDVDELEEVNLDLLEPGIKAENSHDIQSIVADTMIDSGATKNSDNFEDFADLNLDLLDNNLAEFNGDSLAEFNLDLDAIGISNSLVDDDFADLDLDTLSAMADRSLQPAHQNSLDLDESQFSQFENLPELDFELGGDLADLELTDLGNSLADLPTANLAPMDDLDALLGMDNSNTTGSDATFDDLDALMNATPVANFDDLDALMNPNPLDNLDALVVGAASIPTTPISHPAPIVTPPANNSQPKPTGRAKQSRTFEQTMRVSVRHLDNLNNLVGELVVNRNTLEQDQTRMRQFVEKLLSEVQKLNDVGKRMQDLYERSLMENSLVASRQQYKAAAAPSLPVNNEDLGNSGNLMEYDPLEMDRFTPIHLLSQKMIELTVRVRESTADIEFVVDGSTEVTRTLRQITGQLQEDLTKSRMIPFAQTADRLQRGVRDNGLKYGKQVELTVEGRDTLIDKVILESLTDPLIHMVNNAIAHGIESIETRQAAGKSSEGKITIRALHQGNQTIISVSDDGAGINTERVKQKALEKGIITPQKAATMSKPEIYDLLFLPSFSTKDQADELAGRGVGMDVVRTSITEIRGTITTESQLGIGTTFTIRLPLALSIAKALIAVNNKNNIAFPMDGIEDTQDVSPEQIQTNSDGEQCIFWRDEMMPFKPLSDLLGFNRPLTRNNLYTTAEDDSDLVSILILRSDGNLMAIQVDKIIGDQEIAIKPLQGPASKPLGIAGATVMGDGRIIPIADVMELIALAKGTLSRQVSTEWANQIATPAVELPESMVLIVDDSITVRELLSLTFKRAGYRVEQARDGQEAWDKLRAGLPCDIVFCDIEMPRMDGLEFLSRIQKDVALSKVPVAMLTSRGSDRHRQIAAQLGASGYFIKPYLEEALLDAAKRMIKGEVLDIV
jgi:chemotaxis protein histidine kinase CheA/ActR/RegA family two-component response regulator